MCFNSFKGKFNPQKSEEWDFGAWQSIQGTVEQNPETMTG